jgi:branched-chain amino acid transport system permease protein
VFLILGLGAGAVYAAIGLGLVLVHRASGVVNFAHGAMAMYVAYVFVELRESGDLILPVVGLPHRIPLLAAASPPVALGISVLVAALLGLVVHALVFRPLRAAPVLAKVVASVGLMVALQAVVFLHFGGRNRSVAPILSARPVEVFGLTFPRDRFSLVVLVVVVTAALWALYRFTRFGLATRAAAENETAATLLGYSPDRIAAANWVLASVLGGLFGILVAPITALNPISFTLLIVPALAAALVGRLTSFPVTAAAALALGMVQSALVKLQSDVTWLPRLGVREALPLLVIIVVMVVRGQVIPHRSTVRTGRPPLAPRPGSPLWTAAIPVVVAGVALVSLQGEYRLALVTSMIGALVCLSLVVLTGFVGQISLAQMAFAGVAGFTLSRFAEGIGLPFLLAAPLAVALAALAGLLVSVPALRVRGVNLAVVTLAAAVAIEELVFKNPAVAGGLEGARVPAPTVFGLDLGIRGGGAFPRPAFGFLVLAVLTGAALVVRQLRLGRLGRRMLAVRANERAAEAAGVNVTGTKLAAFTISAALAGAAGTLLGYQQGQLSFESFGVFVSLSLLALAYLGGIGTITGALIGGALIASGLAFTALDRMAGLGQYHLLFSGVAVIVATVLFPDGVVRLGERVRRPTAEATR